MGEVLLDELMTTEEVANYFGVTSDKVLRMIRLGRLTAHKKGWVYLILRSDLPTAWPPPPAP